MKSNSAPEINAGSMADIAFLLLVFFLVTTTMDSDLGILRKLPPKIEAPQSVKVLPRNVLNVWVNDQDALMVGGQPMEISALKDYVKTFILNPDNSFDKPEKTKKDVPFLGEVWVSKQIISLQCDKGTSYGKYIHVQNQLARAYNELRNETALGRFGASYKHLQETNQKKKVDAIRKVYPQRISEANPVNR